MTVEEFQALHDAQGGVCAICGQPPSVVIRGESIARLSVDHDHVTGRIRGLLCTSCNRLLGLARDDPDRLAAAIEYLRATRSA